MLSQSEYQKTIANNFASLMKFPKFNFFQKFYVARLGLKLLETFKKSDKMHLEPELLSGL